MIASRQIPKILFTLLKAGLWGHKINDLEFFPLNANDWINLFKEARKQTVTGIVYRGITMLPEEHMPPTPILTKWVAEVDRIERYNKQMNSALSGLLKMYEEQDIFPIVLKGQCIAALYDTPNWRECGDIDLYISPKDRDKAANILKKRGFDVEQHADKSICYRFLGIEVEHHINMIDIEVPSKKKYINIIIQEEEDKSKEKISSIRTLPYTTNLLMLNAHIMKHAIGKGVGLRQLCDIARAYHVYCPMIDLNTLTILYNNAGIEKWSILLHAFLVQYLGLPHEKQPYKNLENEDCTPLLEIILRGGNFGQHMSEKTVSAWRKKTQTIKAFWENRNFAWEYARKEAIWTVLNLGIGQLMR